MREKSVDRELIRTRWEKAAFFLVLLMVIAVTAGALLFDRVHEKMLDEPCIVDGVLDLADWNPEKNKVVHLNGEWEFYRNRWIVSDGDDAGADGLVPVPERWSNYGLDGADGSGTATASYRIHIKNCPDTVNCVSYVPNLQSGYRVYFNDSLVTSRGIPAAGAGRRDTGPGGAAWTYIYVSGEAGLPKDADFDLTIESTGENFEGLVLTPVLADDKQGAMNSGLRYMVASIYFGMMITSLVILGFIFYESFRSVQSLLLYLLNLLMFMRVLLKDEFFGLMQMFLPPHHYFLFSNLLKVLTLALPFIFFFYVSGLLRLNISKQRTWVFVIYELILLIAIALCMKKGYTKEEFYLSLLSLAPFAFMLVRLYRGLREGNREVLPVALCLMFLIGSLSTGSLYRSGLVVLNLSMIPPTFFLAFIVTQDYIFIHKILDRHKEVLAAANLRLQLEESQTALMLSQIKPHFLYNALVAIQVLCKRDSDAAQAAIMNFSQYLRANMSSISSSEPIPFEQELNHIKNYTAIEELRFQSRLKMHYDIRTTAFKVPPLTIEPLVENAIKHGATKNIEGGNVVLAAWETEDAFVVRVTDDGPGFDVSTLEGEEMKSHGLRNILFRLKQVIGAEIVFDSHIDQGTEVTVTIPKNNDDGRGKR